MSVELIGQYQAHRPSCDGSGHKPGCYNPRLGETACLCGQHWWPVELPTWHARHLHDGSRLVGFDVYLLPRAAS